GSLPPRPKLRLGSAALLARAARNPRKLPPLAILSGLAPRGRGSLAPVGELISTANPDRDWPEHPNCWIVTLDYETGRRVAFGRPGSPPATLAEAVMASCSIPG